MNHKCLSCEQSAAGADLVGGYHPKCSRRLFGTTRPPEVPLKTTDIVAQARAMVGKMSISGVQPKLSVIHDSRRHQLTVVGGGGRYILKPPTAQFESLPENENLCMNIASAYAIDVPPHGLVPLMDGELAYIVKRFDRGEDGSKLQQEDFQQLLETNDKYDGSFEKIANFIKKHSSVPGLDLVRLFERALLFYVLGNGDAHLKNFSLIRRPDVGYELSPVYDLVSSRLVLPDEAYEMCLSLQGKKNRLSKEDFKRLGGHFGLTDKQMDNSFDRLGNLRSDIERMIQQSFMKPALQVRLLDIFGERCGRVFQ